MEKIFLSVLNMSLTASFVIAVIMLARLPLKKAPKIISYSLWAVVGFRLVFPFTLESVFSLLPFKSTPIPKDIAIQAVPRIDSGITIIDNTVSATLPAATPLASVNPLQVWITVGSYIWLFGVAVMLIYSIVSIVLLRHKIRNAGLIKGNLYEADNLKTPFVIGLFRPKIYIPVGLSGDELRYIILHEQTHIKRCDQAVKIFAYLILCLHWFNPLAWVTFVLMGADMEMSCDERVMKELGGEIKKAYSLSLVRVAAGHKILNGSPLAFSEGGMKERIKNVLNFKKQSRVIVILSIALVAVLSMGFALNRTEEPVLTSSELVPTSTYEVREWLNYYLDEQMPWGRSLDMELPEYPDTVFQWTAYEVKANDSKGEKILFKGMPVWNVYLADLTGDGLPEFCATISIGSGIVDTRVVVFDYTNDRLYDLSDRGNFDYALTLEDGQLIVTKSEYRGAPLATGDLAIVNDELIMINTTEQQPQEAKPTEDNDELIQGVEDSLEIIMSSPLSSSNPQDYIKEHQEEYDNLTMNNPDGVLEYLLSEFEAGESDGLRGQIMMRICKEILGPSNNVTDESLSPQEWYRQLSVMSKTMPAND